jgi:hypothetical protein
MRIKTQNMIVLTVEFTRIPLSRRRRNHSRDLLHRLHHPLDAGTFLEVTEGTQILPGGHVVSRLNEQ